jgi:hypothetical protein
MVYHEVVPFGAIVDAHHASHGRLLSPVLVLMTTVIWAAVHSVI